MTTSEKLRNLRKGTGRDQEKTAELIGLTTQYYCLLESGKNAPGKKAIALISQYYGISPDFFTSPAVTEAKLKPPDSQREEQRPEEKKLISMPAGNGCLYRMNNGYLCTEPACDWRLRVDRDTYYCPGQGCMKERCGKLADKKGSQT